MRGPMVTPEIEQLLAEWRDAKVAEVDAMLALLRHRATSRAQRGGAAWPAWRDAWDAAAAEQAARTDDVDRALRAVVNALDKIDRL